MLYMCKQYTCCIFVNNTYVVYFQGSILFFDAKAHRHASVCPVLGDAEWGKICHTCSLPAHTTSLQPTTLKIYVQYFRKCLIIELS